MWAKLLVGFLLLTFAKTSKSQEAGSCEDGNFFLPDASDCEKYYACLDGKPELMQCEVGKSYDYYLEICIDTQLSRCFTNEINNTLTECSIEEQLTPNPENCSTYYQCDNGHLVLKPCPPGLHFDPINKVCEYPEDARCEDRTTSTTESSTSQSTEGSTASEEPTEGSTASQEPTQGTTTTEEPTEGSTTSQEPTQSTTTTEEPTQSTTTTEEPTEGSTASSETTQGTTTTEEPTEGTTVSQNPTEGSTTTEEPTTTDNTEGPTETVTTETPTTEEPTSTTEISTSSPTTPPFKPDCPASGMTVVPNPYDCSTFYVCMNGFSYLVHCPAGQFFDEYKQVCVAESQAHCATVTTTTELPVTTESTESTEGTSAPTESNEPTTETSEGTSAPTESNEPTTETSEGTSANTETTTGGTESSSESTTQGPQKPQCPSNDFALLPNPDDCKSFYVCVGGNSALLYCPSGHLFDSGKLECVPAEEAVCYGSTTTEENTTPSASEGTTPETTEPTVTTSSETTTDSQTTPEVTDTPTTTSSETTTDSQTTPKVTDTPTTTDSDTETTDHSTTSQPTQTTSSSEGPTTSPPYKPNCPSEGIAELPNPYDCKTFFICIEGHSALLECPNNLYYDAITLSCVPQTQATCYDSLTTTSSTTEAATTTTEQITETTSTSHPTEITSTTNSEETTTPLPLCKPDGMYTVPNPTDCGSFYVCINGMQALIYCPIGEEFNAEMEICQTPDLAHCQTQSRLIFGLNDETCKEGELTPNDEDCSTYYMCSNNIEILMPCPDGLYFDENVKACVLPESSSCFKTSTSSESSSSSSTTESSSTETSSTPLPTETTSTESSTETSPTSPTESTSPTSSSPSTSTSSPNAPDCPSSGTAVFPNPKNCTTYFVCVEGHAAEINCPTGYQFDSDSGSCVPFNGTCKSYEPDCPPEGVLILPNPNDCTSYFVCIDGDSGLIYCAPNHAFDPDLETCVPSDGSCSEINPSSSSTSQQTTESTSSESSSISTSEEPISTTTTEATSTSTETTSQGSSTSNQPGCDNPKPYPNPDDCGSFYLCDNGHESLLPCPPGLEFSPDDLVCELPDEANCEATKSSRKLFKFNIFNLF